jgi:hypothetical protein
MGRGAAVVHAQQQEQAAHQQKDEQAHHER